MSFTTPQSRYRALLARSPAAHAAFVYAVHTTRIYCRPTCAARLARRANISFFDDARAAAAAGFRACKRCAPDDDARAELQDAARGHAELAKRAIERERGDVVWRDVAREVGRAPRYLHEAFKRCFGVTPGAYAAAVKRAGAVGAAAAAATQAVAGAAVVPEAGAVRPAAGDVETGSDSSGADASASDGMEGADSEWWADALLAPEAAASDDGFAALAGLDLTPKDLGWGSWEDFILWDAVTFPLHPVQGDGQELVGV